MKMAASVMALNNSWKIVIKQYWVNILRRVVAVIRCLAQRGLPFRGEDELLGSVHNGNFLGILELIAQFDPFLQSHLQKYGNAGRGVPSYMHHPQLLRS